MTSRDIPRVIERTNKWPRSRFFRTTSFIPPFQCYVIIITIISYHKFIIIRNVIHFSWLYCNQFKVDFIFFYIFTLIVSMDGTNVTIFNLYDKRSLQKGLYFIASDFLVNIRLNFFNIYRTYLNNAALCT